MLMFITSNPALSLPYRIQYFLIWKVKVKAVYQCKHKPKNMKIDEENHSLQLFPKEFFKF